MREGGEELTGFLGNMEELIKKNGGIYKMQYDSSSSKSSYHVHLFHLDHSDELVNLYNNNHKFLWERMDQEYLTNTKLFEKIEIRWFSMEEMKQRKNEFRSFYKDVIDIIIEQEANIKRFLQAKGKGKANRKSRRKG
jgi:spore coat protein CotF